MKEYPSFCQFPTPFPCSPSPRSYSSFSLCYSESISRIYLLPCVTELGILCIPVYTTEIMKAIHCVTGSNYYCVWVKLSTLLPHHKSTNRSINQSISSEHNQTGLEWKPVCRLAYFTMSVWKAEVNSHLLQQVWFQGLLNLVSRPPYSLPQSPLVHHCHTQLLHIKTEKHTLSDTAVKKNRRFRKTLRKSVRPTCLAAQIGP